MNEVTILIILIVVLIVAVFILFFPKIKAYFKKLSSKNSAKKKDNKKSNNKKTTKNKKNSKNDKNAKVVPSKAEKEFRPILKPPVSESGTNDQKMLNPSTTNKLIDYGDNSQLSYTYKPSNKMMSTPEIVSSITRPSSSNSNTYSFANGTGDENKRDIKKEFEDIRKFLDLPQNKANTGSLQKLYEEYKSNNNSANNVLNNSTENSSVKTVNASSFNHPSTRTSTLQNFVPPNAENRLSTTTKYARSTPINSPTKHVGYDEYSDDDDIYLTPSIKPKTVAKPSSDYLNYEGEDIDLNKLSPKLKKLIIENILKRRNFDD